MTVTSETVVPSVLDSALLRADLEALLDALRRAEDTVEEDTAAWPTPRVKVARYRWEKVLERADLLRQSYILAKARAAMQGQGVGR